MRFDQTILLRGLLLLAAISLSSCGGGGGGGGSSSTPPPVVIPTVYYSIGVTITGLSGTLILHNNRNLSNDPLTFNASGSAAFTATIASGTPYGVSVSSQPTNQFCTVTNGSGTASASIPAITVNCVTAYTIGGTFDTTGGVVPGIGLVLQNNNGDNLPVSAGATTFTFSTKLTTVESYAVTVLSQPRSPRQQCSVAAGSGGPISGNITSVVIQCLTAPTLTDVSRFAYVANNDDTVSIYTVNAATGQLRPNGYTYLNSGTSASTRVSTVAVDPSGKFLYVMNATTHNVSAYSINSDTGKLTAVTGSPFSVDSTSFPSFGTVDPSGRFTYVTNTNSNDVSAYRIDLGTGALTRVPCLGGQGAGCSGTSYLNYPVNYPSGGAPTSVAVHPNGAYAYVTHGSGVSVYDVDNYGALTATSNTSAGTGPNSIGITPDGLYAYVANGGGNIISAYAVDGTGALVSNGTTSLTGNLRSVAVDPYGDYVFVANNNNNNVSAYSINVGGTLAFKNTVQTGTGPVSVSADPSGKYAYVANSGSADVSVYTIGVGGLTAASSIRARAGSSSIAVTRGLAPVTNAPYPVAYLPTLAYVANSVSGDVSGYSIGIGGALATIDINGAAAGTTIAAGTTPTSVTVDPSGQYVFVTNSDSADISVFDISSTTLGALSPDPNSPVTAPGTPSSIKFEPSGRYAYVTDSTNGRILGYSLDVTTGALTSIDTDTAPASQTFITTGASPSSVTIDPTGRFAYVTNSGDATVSAYSINASSGALSSVGPAVGAGTAPSSVTVDPTGKFAYVANSLTNDISAYNIDSGTGALTLISCNVDGGGPCNNITNFLAGTAPTSVTIDPTGRYAYVANNGSNNVSAYTINANGTLTEMGTSPFAVGAGTGPKSVTVDISGQYVYVANNNGTVSTFTIGVGGALSGGATIAAGTTPAFIATTGTIQ